MPRGGATRVGAAGAAGSCVTETDGFWRDRDDLPILDSQRDWLLLLLRGSHNVFSQRYAEKNSLECSPKLRHGIKGPATLNETHFSRVYSLPMSGSRREAAQNSNLFALFDCIIDPETGAYLSEDYSFCLHWRRIGGEIWLDAASKLTHCGPYEFVGDHASRFYGVTGSKDSTAGPR